MLAQRAASMFKFVRSSSTLFTSTDPKKASSVLRTSYPCFQNQTRPAETDNRLFLQAQDKSFPNLDTKKASIVREIKSQYAKIQHRYSLFPSEVDLFNDAMGSRSEPEASLDLLYGSLRSNAIPKKSYWRYMGQALVDLAEEICTGDLKPTLEERCQLIDAFQAALQTLDELLRRKAHVTAGAVWHAVDDMEQQLADAQTLVNDLYRQLCGLTGTSSRDTLPCTVRPDVDTLIQLALHFSE